MMTTPQSQSPVGTPNTSIRGICGSTQSRKTRLRRSANSAHRGIAVISSATPGLASSSDSRIPSTKAPPYALANATASSTIFFFAERPIRSVPHSQGSVEPSSVGRHSLNSICSPSGTSESINSSRSAVLIWSAGFVSTEITNLFPQQTAKRVPPSPASYSLWPKRRNRMGGPGRGGPCARPCPSRRQQAFIRRRAWIPACARMTKSARETRLQGPPTLSLKSRRRTPRTLHEPEELPEPVYPTQGHV